MKLQRKAKRFHPTLVLAQRSLSQLKTSPTSWVSIPHWFSLNQSRAVYLSQSNVSIPHWFSLNESKPEETKPLASCFHPTLVLAQLTWQTDYLERFRSFHPTLVLAQPCIAGQPARQPTCRFHPTLVLAQRTNRQERGSDMSVSIPHWFSLRRAVHRQSSQSMDPSFERARRGEKERE